MRLLGFRVLFVRIFNVWIVGDIGRRFALDVAAL